MLLRRLLLVSLLAALIGVAAPAASAQAQDRDDNVAAESNTRDGSTQIDIDFDFVEVLDGIVDQTNAAVAYSQCEACTTIAIAIQVVLRIRAAVQNLRGTVSEIHAFATGDLQRVRLAEVSEPKGWIWPKSTAVIELEAEDERIHRLEREIPVAAPYAWGYRLSKRSKLPLVSRLDPTKALAFELRRNGASVEIVRPAAESPEP